MEPYRDGDPTGYKRALHNSRIQAAKEAQNITYYHRQPVVFNLESDTSSLFPRNINTNYPETKIYVTPRDNRNISWGQQ
jgi:hypothetical protein